MAYTVTGLGGAIYGGFRCIYYDLKHNGKWAGYGRPYPGEFDPTYAVGFSFKDGFSFEALDRGNVSWVNGKRLMNGTFNLFLFPLKIGATGYKALNFLIDQTITTGAGYGVGKGLDKIP